MPMDRITTVTEVLTALGDIVRRVQAGSLDPDTFYRLAGEMRRKLKALRVELTRDELPIDLDLTDLGAALGDLLADGTIKPASALLDALPDRCRTSGRFVVIDGGRPFETPYIGA